jgi:hypothetical protein
MNIYQVLSSSIFTATQRYLNSDFDIYIQVLLCAAPYKLCYSYQIEVRFDRNAYRYTCAVITRTR